MESYNLQRAQYFHQIDQHVLFLYVNFLDLQNIRKQSVKLEIRARIVLGFLGLIHYSLTG